MAGVENMLQQLFLYGLSFGLKAWPFHAHLACCCPPFMMCFAGVIVEGWCITWYMQKFAPLSLGSLIAMCLDLNKYGCAYNQEKS